MDNIHSNVTGTIIAYFSNIEPDGWVLCNGVPRDNSEGLYNKLLELGIGKCDDKNNYVPPNLNNTFITGLSNDIDNKSNFLSLMNTRHEFEAKVRHKYILNNKVFTEYNNNNNNSCELSSLNNNINMVSYNVQWIIKR